MGHTVTGARGKPQFATPNEAVAGPAAASPPALLLAPKSVAPAASVEQMHSPVPRSQIPRPEHSRKIRVPCFARKPWSPRGSRGPSRKRNFGELADVEASVIAEASNGSMYSAGRSPGLCVNVMPVVTPSASQTVAPPAISTRIAGIPSSASSAKRI